jgi:O-antigen/teichoic acid export membrane protein
MLRIWWPEPLYEMKPYGALAIGLFAALLGIARSWAVGSVDAGFAAVLLFAVASIAYAIAVLRMRNRYRRRSRWNRERGPLR